MVIKKGNTYIKEADVCEQNKLSVFQVEIKEELKRTIQVIAKDENTAYEIAINLYHESEIVLDSEDYSGVDVYVVGELEKNTNNKNKEQER